MALREPQRLLLFALTVLIHVGLFELLVSERHSPIESPRERRTVLVFLEDTPTRTIAPIEVAPIEIAPIAPRRRPETSPPPSAAPTVIAPPKDEVTTPPIDWQREAEEAGRKHALEAEANQPSQSETGPPKVKPEFGWSHSRTHRIEPMESGGFVVWINDNCGVVIGIMAMPFCKIGKKPPRGDLFEHMDDPPTPGDWKDD